eukprot:2799274-Rhodomonas_salina.1
MCIRDRKRGDNRRHPDIVTAELFRNWTLQVPSSVLSGTRTTLGVLVDGVHSTDGVGSTCTDQY